MTESEAIKKAIRHFECMKNDAVVVLDSGFGTHPGESDLVYRNRKMYAELAIQALEKQIPKKPIPIDYKKYMNVVNNAISLRGGFWCPNCKKVVRSGSCCNDCGQKLDWSDEE